MGTDNAICDTVRKRKKYEKMGRNIAFHGGAAPRGELVTMVTSLLLSHFFFVPVKHACIFLYPTNMAT